MSRKDSSGQQVVPVPDQGGAVRRRHSCERQREETEESAALDERRPNKSSVWTAEKCVHPRTLFGRREKILPDRGGVSPCVCRTPSLEVLGSALPARTSSWACGASSPSPGLFTVPNFRTSVSDMHYLNNEKCSFHLHVLVV